MTAGFCSRFHQAVELIGARWTGAIIRVLTGGPVRYSALRDAIPDISDRMLSERLRELEAEGVVTRLVLPDPPIGVEYALTEKGPPRRLWLSAETTEQGVNLYIRDNGPGFCMEALGRASEPLRQWMRCALSAHMRSSRALASSFSFFMPARVASSMGSTPISASCTLLSSSRWC